MYKVRKCLLCLYRFLTFNWHMTKLMKNNFTSDRTRPRCVISKGSKTWNIAYEIYNETKVSNWTLWEQCKCHRPLAVQAWVIPNTQWCPSFKPCVRLPIYLILLGCWICRRYWLKVREIKSDDKPDELWSLRRQVSCWLARRLMCISSNSFLVRSSLHKPVKP